LSLTVTAPARGPDAVGVKVTLIVQLAPLARLVPQVFFCAKSPLVVMLAMLKTALPVLLRVTIKGALVVWTI
jgi:hypothetical protein